LEWKNDGVMDDNSGDDDTGGEMIVEKRWIRKRQIKTWLTKWVMTVLASC